MKPKYYSLDKILSFDADYNVIYGERSNGKTTAVLAYALKDHIESGYQNQLGIVRRWEEDFKGKNGRQMFDGIVNLGWIQEWTKGKYNSVYYYGQRWYLCKYDDDGNKKYQAEEPFAFGFSITSEEHYKSTSYPNIKTILFDEFITRSYYIPDEFIKFQNLLSTLIRLRTDVKIFMCGNTVNKFCPYFTEMGLNNVKKQKQGTIDVYTYGESELKVAVEYSDFNGHKKASNKYFAFDNPKLQMIKTGNWEIDIYPHCPCKYVPSEVKYTYYIQFDEYTLQCQIVKSKKLKNIFTFIHKKTTPIHEDDKSLVFALATSPYRHVVSNITRPTTKLTKFIYNQFASKKVFYADNEIGEIVRNFIMECQQATLI